MLGAVQQCGTNARAYVCVQLPAHRFTCSTVLPPSPAAPCPPPLLQHYAPTPLTCSSVPPPLSHLQHRAAVTSLLDALLMLDAAADARGEVVIAAPAVQHGAASGERVVLCAVPIGVMRRGGEMY
eukprot:3783-Chlamydomonas_euryale.AAC.3